MSDEEELIVAERLISTGQRATGKPILLEIVRNTRSQDVKLGAILALMTCLNQLDDAELLMGLADEGVTIAQLLGQEDARAFLNAHRANLSQNEIGLPVYEKENMRLAPRWLGFALESEEKRFNELVRQIEEKEKIVSDLMGKALEFVRSSSDECLSGNIFRIAGEIYGKRYSDHKIEILRRRIGPRWLRDLVVGRTQYENILGPFLYRKEDRKKFEEYKSLCVRDHILAIEAFERAGDIPGKGYAYFSLALQYRTFYEFGKAKKAVRQARSIAEKINDADFLWRISEIEKDIRTKNKSIPDYLAGERRPARTSKDSPQEN